MTNLSEKDMVVLKRNDKSDKNVVDAKYPDANLYLDSSNKLFVFHIPTQTWKESNLNGEEEVMQSLKPIEKKEMKEFLDTVKNYTLVKDTVKRSEDWIEVPDSADKFIQGVKYPSRFGFLKGGKFWDGEWIGHSDKRDDYTVLWQRESLNDKVASAEVARQDNVNHPQHYAGNGVECIDAMQAMLTPEQFVGYLRGNAFKYQWRYSNKGGLEDLKKSQWYLNKLIEVEAS